MGGWRQEDLKFKIEGGWLYEDRHSRFEDLIMPHQHLIHEFMFILCRKWRYFEDIALNFPFEDDSQLFHGLHIVHHKMRVN